MRASIGISTARGSIAAPPSKSYAHRLLMAAALAGAGARVDGISGSEDMLATLDCISALGGSFLRQGESVSMTGSMCAGSELPVLPCRESGSTLRFFIPLALVLRTRAEMRGSSRLMERGISVYEELFAHKGVSVEKSSDCIRLSGRLEAGEYTLRGDVSSQFITGLLFALPLLEGESTLNILPPVESRSYIDITVDVLGKFGIRVEQTGENSFRIPGSQTYLPHAETVESDWSNAAFLEALNFCGGQVQVEGLRTDSRQGDRVCVDMLRALHTPGVSLDLSDCPDLGPVLFAMAAAGGGAAFTGIRRLRIKESDRVLAMAQELAKFGIETQIEENRAVILPGTLQTPTQTLDAHNDHRIAMALSVLCTRTGGVIEGVECVRKSYPSFFEAIGSLGVEEKLEA